MDFSSVLSLWNYWSTNNSRTHSYCIYIGRVVEQRSTDDPGNYILWCSLRIFRETPRCFACWWLNERPRVWRFNWSFDLGVGKLKLTGMSHWYWRGVWRIWDWLQFATPTGNYISGVRELNCRKLLIILSGSFLKVKYWFPSFECKTNSVRCPAITDAWSSAPQCIAKNGFPRIYALFYNQFDNRCVLPLAASLKIKPRLSSTCEALRPLRLWRTAQKWNQQIQYFSHRLLTIDPQNVRMITAYFLSVPVVMLQWSALCFLTALMAFSIQEVSELGCEFLSTLLCVLAICFIGMVLFFWMVWRTVNSQVNQ